MKKSIIFVGMLTALVCVFQLIYLPCNTRTSCVDRRIQTVIRPNGYKWLWQYAKCGDDDFLVKANHIDYARLGIGLVATVLFGGAAAAGWYLYQRAPARKYLSEN